MWLAFHLLTVAVLAGIVELTCRRLRPRPSVCHLLWLAVLVKLIMPPVVSWPWALPDSGALDQFAVLEFDLMPSEAPAAPAGTADSAGAVPPAAALAEPEPFAIDLFSTGAGLWIMGALGGVILQALRIGKLRRLSRMATPAPDWLNTMADEMAQRLDVRRPRVLLAGGLCSAAAFNPWRPKVLVSEDLLTAVSREDVQCILAHELAHLKRRDLWVGLIELAAQCVWWWNPLLYVVRRRLHLYREMAADAWVLWALPDRQRHYAETLVRVVDLASQAPAPLAAFGMASGPAATFERRLTMVLHAASPCRLPRLALTATLLLLVLVVPGWSADPPEIAPPAAVADETPAPDTPAGTPTMVAEFQGWWFTSNKVGFESLDWFGSEKRKKPPARFSASDMAASNQNNGGAMLIGIITGAVKVNVGGRTLSAQDRELRWGENGKPEEKDAAEIFSATVGLRPDQNTLIKVHKREQAVPVSPVQQLELSLRPEQDKLRAWITLPQHESLPDLPMCLNILLPTRQNQWQAAIFSVSNPRGTKPGVFLLFYKVQTATPDLLKQVETGDTGDCVVTRAAAESPDGVYATAEFKIIDLPQAEFQKIAAVLEPPVAPANGVSRLSPVWRATSVEAMEDLLDQSKGELVSAPRVTFRVTDGSLKIVQRGQYPISDVLEGSEAFLKFWGEGMPTAIIADLRSEMFVDRSKKLVQLSEGLIAAIGATQTNEDTLDVRLFVEDRRLKRHKRGLAFWKPRRLPEVAYAPVESHFVSGYGNTVVLEAPTPKPDARRLVMLTIDKAETGPRFFEAGYNAGTN